MIDSCSQQASIFTHIPASRDKIFTMIAGRLCRSAYSVATKSARHNGRVLQFRLTEQVRKRSSVLAALSLAAQENVRLLHIKL